MSLIERVALADRNRLRASCNVDYEATKESNNRPLLPFDTVRQYLESHPLVLSMQIDPFDVYMAILDIHVTLKSKSGNMNESTSENITDCP